ASIALAVLLGSRAYRVASTHSNQITDLVNREIPAEALLARMETQAAARDQALKKLRITRDSRYEQLSQTQDKNADQTKREIIDVRALDDAALAQAYSGAGSLEQVEQMKTLRKELAQRRELKLKQARDDARGILQSIMIALALSIGLSA